LEGFQTDPDPEPHNEQVACSQCVPSRKSPREKNPHLWNPQVSDSAEKLYACKWGPNQKSQADETSPDHKVLLRGFQLSAFKLHM